ncbi:hypothetical protein KY359_02405 [Candidatus Woesearchaeota archaeon]|nr:hypothetical protein [Candidatus Woesearchaeota archaeon]
MKTERKPSRCHKCIRKAAYKLVDKWYCKKCFCSLVEQKLRHNLRNYGLKRDSSLLVTDKASEHVVKKIVNIPVRTVKGKKQADFLVLPWTMDDENEEFLRMLFDNKKIVTKENRKIIKLFCPVSKKDMKTYFTLNKVAYRPEKTEINSVMDELEKRYPGTKTALLKSEERLKQALR